MSYFCYRAQHATCKNTKFCRRMFSYHGQLSRAAQAKRHLMETPLVMLTGHQLHHRDFQGPGWRQVPTATSSHRQPDHSVLGEEWVWCVPVFSCVACRILEYHKMFLHVQWISKDDSARKTLWCASSASVWEAEPRQCWLPASTSSSIPPSLWLVLCSINPCLTRSLCNHQPVLIYILPKKY